MRTTVCRIANFHNVPLSVADDSSYAVQAHHAHGLSDAGVADPARRVKTLVSRAYCVAIKTTVAITPTGLRLIYILAAYAVQRFCT
jgi:hypothetical protein